MNKHRKIIIFSFLLLAITAFSFALVQNTGAAFEYEPMEGIPGFEDETMGKKEPDLKAWIESTYKFFMWVVGICALFMITIGGFTYMTSAGNTSKAGTGKQIITDAIIGLILALVAVLLFTVINPNITSVNVQISPAETSTSDEEETTDTGGTGAASDTGVTVSSESSSEAVSSLKANNNVSVDTSGDCKDASGNVISPSYTLTQAQNGGSVTACNSSCEGGNSPCGKSVSLSTKLLDAINTVGTSNSLRVSSLTGGQHSKDTSTHYSGTAADIVPSADKSQWSSIVSQFESAGCNQAGTSCDKGGKFVTDCTQADHIHINCS